MYPVGYVGPRVSECGPVAPPMLTVACMSHKHLDPFLFFVSWVLCARTPHSSVHVFVLYTCVPEGLTRVPVSWEPHFCVHIS